MQIFGSNAKDFLEIYEVALRLARRRGKKPGERFDKEFWEVAERKEKKHKFKELQNEYDIKQYLKEG